MKKTLATLAIAGMLALTGCSPNPNAAENGNPGDIRVEYVSLNDGRTVACIVRGNMNSTWGAMTCDWDGAK